MGGMIVLKEQYPVIPGAESFFYRGNEIGILLSHGFVGTPQSVRAIGEAFHHLGYTVLAPRLAGHGTHFYDLENCLKEDWFHSLDVAYQQLQAECTTVFVLGQSMGGTLALQLAQKYDNIDGLILINSALTIPSFEQYRKQLTPRFIPEGKPDIKMDHVEEITYDFVPIKAIHELQSMMDVTRMGLSEITQPIAVLKSARDHVVPTSNSDLIVRQVQSNYRELHTLHHSYHVASMDHDQGQIVRQTKRFIESLSAQFVSI